MVIVQSSSAGATWGELPGSTCLTNNLLRAFIAVTPANPDLLYSVVLDTDRTTHLCRFSASGLNWTDKGPVPAYSIYPSGAMAVSPTNPGLLYIGGLSVERCINADQSGPCAWQGVGTGHADVGSIKFSRDATTIWAATDGGIFQTTPSNTPWIPRSDGLGVATILGMATAATDSRVFLFGLYDNGTQLSLDDGKTWAHSLGGDGLQPMVDYMNPQNMYASFQYGYMFRSADEGGSGFPYGAYPPAVGDWHTFAVLNSANPKVFYAAAHPEVWRTANQGMSGTWKEISNIGWGDIWRLYTAPSDPNYLYAEALDWSTPQVVPYFYRTTDANCSSPPCHWDEIPTPSGLVICPTGAPNDRVLMLGLAVDPNDPEVFTVAFPGYCAAVPQRVFQYDGHTWTDWDPDQSLPPVSIDSIVAAPGTGGYLYVGTFAGVYYTNNTMTGWLPYGNSLPHTRVTALDIYCNPSDPNNGRLHAGTFGRGAWEIPVTCPQN